MDLIEMAKKSGMQVLLDAQIGSQLYHSVCGPLSSLQRFADEVGKALAAEAAARAAVESASEEPEALRSRCTSGALSASPTPRTRAPPCARQAIARNAHDHTDPVLTTPPTTTSSLQPRARLVLHRFAAAVTLYLFGDSECRTIDPRVTRLCRHRRQRINLRIEDTASGQVVFQRSVDMRGNTDPSWQRAVDALVGLLSAGPYSAR